MLPTPSNHYDASTLQSEFAPNVEESTGIRESMAAHERFIRSIDGRLSAMEREMNELRSRREAASEALEIQQGLLAPVRRLTPVILEKIFDHAVGHAPSMSTAEAPFVLTQVCHKWRTVALGSHHLWSHVEIDDENKNADRMISMWLSRSESVPLDININTRDMWGTLCSSATRILLPEVHRWRSLAFSGHLTVFNDALPVITASEFTSLRSLTVALLPSPYRIPGDFPWNDVGRHWKFPQLRSLELWSSAILLRSTTFTSNLRRLVIRKNENPAMIPYATWMAMWKTCSNLEDVHVDLACVAPGTDLGSLTTFHYHHLRRLVVWIGVDCNTTYDMLFLANLHAPRLQCLEFCGRAWWSSLENRDAIFAALHRLMTGCSSTLNQLRLSGIHFTTERVRELLRTATELHKLRIESAFITALCPSPDDVTTNERICPKVTTLGILGNRLSMADLVAMIVRRATPSPNDPPGTHYLTHVEAEGAVRGLLGEVQSLGELNVNLVEGANDLPDIW